MKAEKRNGGVRFVKMLLAINTPFLGWIIEWIIDFVNLFDKYPIGVYYELVKIPHRGMRIYRSYNYGK